MPPLMVAVHFGRALVRRAELELLHETSSTATRHHLPNGLDVTDLHKTKPVCACAAQRPSNASTSRPGDASESACPEAPPTAPRSPGPSAPHEHTRFVEAQRYGKVWASQI